ncbi:hypothetical protein VP501E541_P0096 [Vibrio phage 501E54-1]|nr:hypothetical protein VP501E541_P0096 [Vibrio phage 501E54-1]
MCHYNDKQLTTFGWFLCMRTLYTDFFVSTILDLI